MNIMTLQKLSYIMTRLTIRSAILINKRFYPGGQEVIKLTAMGYKISHASSVRILKILNKQNVLTNHPIYSQPEPFVNGIFQLYGGNRSEFFNAIRNFRNNEITLSRAVFKDNPEAFPHLNTIAEVVRFINFLPSKPRESKLQQIAKDKDKDNKPPLRGLSLEEKKTAFLEKHNAIINKMKIAQINYEKDKSIDWTTVEEWMKYIETRGSVIPEYTLDEIKGNAFLLKVFIENTDAKDIVVSKVEDNLGDLKKKSNLDKSLLSLLEKLPQQIFTIQDCEDSIRIYNEIRKVLDTGMLNEPSILLLGIIADAMSLDEGNNPKLNRDVYAMQNTSPEQLGIKYTGKTPNVDEVMDALKNKRYYVRQSSEEIPPGQLVSTAPLLHKTIVILTKDGWYITAMFTSSKTDTELLSLTQESNVDPELANKEQRFVVFSRFILCKDIEKTLADLLALGFSHGINLEGENVHDKIIKCFEDKQHIWGNNEVQELMNFTPEILTNIIKIFLENKLEIVKNKYNEMKLELENMTEEQRERYHEKRLKQKENKINEQNEQKYLSKLPEKFQKLLISLNLFEKESKRQKEFAIEREAKSSKNKPFEEQQRKLKEERERTGQLTAKERREALQKQLKEKREAEAAAKGQIEKYKSDRP